MASKIKDLQDRAAAVAAELDELHQLEPPAVGGRLEVLLGFLAAWRLSALAAQLNPGEDLLDRTLVGDEAGLAVDRLHDLEIAVAVG